MRYHEIITESSRAPLYHSLDISRAISFLDLGYIEGRTYHRIWLDGLRRKEDNPDYEDSILARGISTTRDINFAKNWQNVIFVLDWDTIRKTHKIMQYAWNYHLDPKYSPSPNHKKEKEEFIITGIDKRTWEQVRKDWKKIEDERYSNKRPNSDLINIDRDFMEYATKPMGRPIDLKKCLVSISLSQNYVDIDKKHNNHDKEKIDKITAHPKFKGFF